MRGNVYTNAKQQPIYVPDFEASSPFSLGEFDEGDDVRPVTGVALLEWARGVIDDIVAQPAPPATGPTPAETSRSDS